MSTELKPLTERFVKNLYWIGLVALFIGIAISSGIGAAFAVIGFLLAITGAILHLFNDN